MTRNPMTRDQAGLSLVAMCLMGALIAVPPATAAEVSTNALSIQGTCLFGGKTSTWSATLKPKGNGTYDAVYISSWGGQPLNYVGTLKTDLKTEISGMGQASGGRANGTFEFSGKYGADGIAKCSYSEVGGRGRGGTMTAELPKPAQAQNTGKAKTEPSR